MAPILTIEIHGDEATVTGPIHLMMKKFPKESFRREADGRVKCTIYDPIENGKKISANGNIRKVIDDSGPRQDWEREIYRRCDEEDREETA